MVYPEAVVAILGIVSAAVVCCCICFCANIKTSPAHSDPLPRVPAGPVYIYDMTQDTAPEDSAPPPYHLATLYPPVDVYQQMNPPVYQDVALL